MIELSEESKEVCVLDTTLRDGAQGRDISFSAADKLKVAKKLDDFGVDYIEAGWVPGNPKDDKFFRKIKNEDLKNSSIVACGSTRRPTSEVEEDKSIEGLIESGAEAVSLVGKTWLFHVKEVLDTTPEENLAMIHESIEAIKDEGREVVYDAEHFFDGYFADPVYALETLKAAEDAGVDYVTLCDTNGGTVPRRVAAAVSKVDEKVDVGLGIHTHDDSGLAVANSVAAVRNGVELLQGTVNGYGERVGNVDLCTLIPNLELKTDFSCLSGEKKLEEIT